MSDIHPAVASFIAEARDILEGLEDLLLDLEVTVNPEQIDAVFRALHTIKGSGAMFGFSSLARFTHHFEDAFDRVREGRLVVDSGLINLSLQARDHMNALLETGGDGSEATVLENASHAHSLLTELAQLTGAAPKAPGDTAASAASAENALPEETSVRWEIRFRPEPDALRNGMRPDLLVAELCTLGKAEVILTAPCMPALKDLDPTQSYLGWTITLETARPRSEIEAIFIFADDADLGITSLEEPSAPPDDAADTQTSELAAVTPGTSAVPATSRTPESARENVRVPASKLDEIIDQLGELVIVQSRLHQIAVTARDPVLDSVVEDVERLVASLRDATLSVRMVPIEVVFGKFRRVVRDLSVELGKDVTLVTEGGETELDKNVIDRLSEPLVHMIRNAMDHGIESEETRRARGKPARGTVTLAARQEGGEVLISISDDGGGLDTEAIREKAIERGLLLPDAQPSVAELHQMIFAPGFSTARALSSVSGRGVGMDAVRTAINALRGGVEVSSQQGQGTCATLRLPVTLAIIDGLLVRLGDGVFVIPLSAVEECVDLDEAECSRESGRSMLRIREHLVAFLELNSAFGLPSKHCDNRRVVVVRAEGQRLGLVVDDILGLNQTVIKALSLYHRDIAGLAGATILGDGTVALIIDVVTLCRQAGIAQHRTAA